MRGPLLSGPVGSRITLERLAERLRAHANAQAPVVVLSTAWLGEALAEALPVVLLVEAEGHRAARRALRASQEAGKGRPLLAAQAGEQLPLRRGAAAAIVLEGLTEIEAADAVPYLTSLVPYLSPTGVLIALDGTKSAVVEAQLAGQFLGAGLLHIGQERPREGALLTFGAAPPALTVTARAMGVALGPNA